MSFIYEPPRFATGRAFGLGQLKVEDAGRAVMEDFPHLLTKKGPTHDAIASANKLWRVTFDVNWQWAERLAVYLRELGEYPESV